MLPFLGQDQMSIGVAEHQDMLLTMNNSISEKAPPAIRDLITSRSSKSNLPHDYILSLPKVNTTQYGLKSWRYFSAKKWKELANDMGFKVATNEVKNKIRLLKFDWNRDLQELLPVSLLV